MWLAGGGIKPGMSFGETDDLGYATVSGKTSFMICKPPFYIAWVLTTKNLHSLFRGEISA
jgi:hypothetical protein